MGQGSSQGSGAPAAIYAEDDTGDEFFTINSGEATAHIKTVTGGSQQVAVLRAGDYFGEIALLRDEGRNQHPLVAGALLNQDLAAGTSVIEQGDATSSSP